MKKFSFSLQKLLSYKEQLFDVERTILGDMRAALARMTDELAHLRTEYKERSLAFNRRAAEGTTAREMELDKMYLSIVENNIGQKLAQIELQRKAIDRQMDKVREAKKEISTMEKLRERKHEEYLYMESKANEQFIEEFVSNTRASKPAMP